MSLSKLYRLPVILMVLFIMLEPAIAAAQRTVVKGIVTDAATSKPLSFVSVYFPNTNIGTSTDDNGAFVLSTTEKVTLVEVSHLGYRSFSRALQPGEQITLSILLEEDATVLNEVVVKVKKERYRNKDNPAVALIRKVIEHKDENRMSNYESLSYQEYEKIRFALSNKPEKLHNNMLVKRYPFFRESIDTTRLEGRAILPIYMEEVLSDNYQTFSLRQTKKIITGQKKVNFDEDFLDNNGFGVYLKHIYQPVDIYDGNITVVTNQFMSPVADLAPTFYKYYIVDTVEVNGEKFIDLFFSPRNKADFLFTGNMLITLDSNYAISKVNLKVNKNINLNWVKDIRILQEFEKNETGKYILTKSRMAADFGMTKNSDGGIFGERTVSYKNYRVNGVIPDSVFRGDKMVVASEAMHMDDTFWTANRHEYISQSEKAVYANMDSLQSSRSFKQVMNMATLLLAGYTKASDYVEIGPVNTFYSFNPVEGFRLRLGGRTTPKLSRHFYLESYAAYGFRDERWKYYTGGTYSFTGNNRFTFPSKGLSVSYQQDTKIPGQELQFVQEDNVLLSIKRGVNDKWLYNKIFNLHYYQEFSNNISYKVGFKNWQQEAAGGLQYTTEQTLTPIEHITTSELFFEFRWAPHQKFIQGKTYRIPFPNKYPVFTLRGTAGIRDLLGGEYNYQKLTLNVYKRFYLSQLGYTDVVAEGGYLFGRVPYPLLDIHRANQTYSYQLQSYNLMNFLESVSDHYVSVQAEHAFNGFFLNKIPLVKKLKFREFASIKVLYGGLRPENTPDGTRDDLLAFPVNNAGQQTTFSLAREPYVEGSVGVGNILKFFRVDLVRRITYLNHPNVTEWGIRARFKFDF